MVWGLGGFCGLWGHLFSPVGPTTERFGYSYTVAPRRSHYCVVPAKFFYRFEFHTSTMDPIRICQSEADKLHGQRCCICVREHDGQPYAHCIKFSTNPHNRWKNTIGEGKANVPMNKHTPDANCLVLKSCAERPVHVITVDGGTVTLYHGRYKCVDPTNKFRFLLEFCDEGIAKSLEQEQEATRKSKLEEDAEAYFASRGWQAVYEPCMFRWKQGTYTPDFYLPVQNCFVEIKGFLAPNREVEPTPDTLAKLRSVAQKGFAIILVQGSAHLSPIFSCYEPFARSAIKQAPWWWKKRKLM